jgi:hypothetical protein
VDVNLGDKTYLPLKGIERNKFSSACETRSENEAFMITVSKNLVDLKTSVFDLLKRSKLLDPFVSLQQYGDVGAVYIFSDEEGKIWYIGKASSLKNRFDRHLGLGSLNGLGSLVENRSTPHRKLKRLGKQVNWDFFQTLQVRILPIAVEADRVCIETILIDEFRPDANI